MGSSCSCSTSKNALIPYNEDSIEVINTNGQVRVYANSKRNSNSNKSITPNKNITPIRKRRHSSVF